MDEQETRRNDVDATALERVVDDLAPREQCADWILEQMRAGRTAEEITAQLVAAGWCAEDAAELTEYVRRATRQERGVITRDDVARQCNQRYRQSWRLSWFLGAPTLAAGVRLLIGLRNLASLRRIRGKKPREEQWEEKKSGVRRQKTEDRR